MQASSSAVAWCGYSAVGFILHNGSLAAFVTFLQYFGSSQATACRLIVKLILQDLGSSSSFSLFFEHGCASRHCFTNCKISVDQAS
jgi:hypothetical protein